MAADRDAMALDRIAYWDAGSPGYRWNEIAMQQTVTARVAVGVLPPDGAAQRSDLRCHHRRLGRQVRLQPRPPGASDAALSTPIPTPNSPSYPDEHAATAGAAAAVLAYLFPDEAERFQTLAEEAADSRVQAGVAYPSDAAAGLALGQEVGKLVVGTRKTDGSDAKFDITQMPTGVGIWTGNPGQPADDRDPQALGAGLRRSVPSRAPTRSGLRGAGRGACRSAGIRAQYGALHRALVLAAGPGGTTSTRFGAVHQQPVRLLLRSPDPLLWQPELAQKLFEYRWDTNAPRSARAYALVSIAG